MTRTCDFFRLSLDLCSGTLPVDLRLEPPDFLADAGVPLASGAAAASGSAAAAAAPSSDFFASVDSAGALGCSAAASDGSFFSSEAVASSGNKTEELQVSAHIQ